MHRVLELVAVLEAGLRLLLRRELGDVQVIDLWPEVSYILGWLGYPGLLWATFHVDLRGKELIETYEVLILLLGRLRD